MEKEQETEVQNTVALLEGAGSFVDKKYEFAKRHRDLHEQRWLKWFDQFRGNYSQEEKELLSNIKVKNPYASEAFIKVTKTKTLAAVGSLIEALVAGNRFPIGVEETPEPEGVAKKVYEDPTGGPSEVDDLASTYGYPGDGRSIDRGTTFKDLFNGLGSKYSRLFKDGKLVAGDSPDPTNIPEVYPAREAAEKMNNVIQDQLTEADAISCIEGMLWEMSIFGTGCIKGPFTYEETLHMWDFGGEGKPKYKPRKKLRPYITNPSIWNIFPDPYAECTKDMDFLIERHKMTKAQLARLRKQSGFDAAAIDIVLRQPGGIPIESWETTLRDYTISTEDDRYEVLEFWGNMPYELAEQYGFDLDGIEDVPVVPVCIWSVNGKCIKKQINPFIPERIPYYLVPYEENMYQLWGIGVPENMEDSQRMINVHTRAGQDNLRLAGSCMLEVNESQLAPNQDNSIYAGKIWRKQGGAPGQSIYPITFSNTAPAHLQFINEANRWADQSSGIPSVNHGQTGVTGTGRTAYGLNAIMNAGNLSIRTVVKNVDRELLKPLGQALFNWNMQFNTDVPEIRGDLKIVAKGASALAQKEVQSQRLISLLQIAANPLVAPFVNVPNIMHDLAVSLDLDPNDIVNDPDQAKLFAKIIGEQANVQFGDGTQAQEGANQAGAGGNGGAVQGDDPNNPVAAGGGSIGVPDGATSRQTTNAPIPA